MKYARCPNCKRRLGIPSKKRGRPITCPKCDTEFTAPEDLDNKSSTSENATKSKPKGKSKPTTRGKPSVRAIPLPSGVAPATAETSTVNKGLDLTPPAKAKAPVDLTPPNKSTDELMPPTKAEASATSPPVTSPLDPPTPKSTAPEPPAPTKTTASKAPLPVASIAKPVAAGKPAPAPTTASATDPVEPTKATRSVATIIKTESVQPSLTKDGKLPTLQLNDETEAKPKEETKSNPVLLVAVLGASLVSSALMMLMVSGNSDQQSERIEKTREQIRVFYEVRPDQEIKPYQAELRHAQLAHSRSDFRTEIRAYESVMARFRDENFDQYTGLTGSQNSDRELEKWVSVLLDEAKRNAKR